MQHEQTGDGWRMVLGDCIEGMRTLHDAEVDVTISDPPFEDQAHTKQRRVRKGTANSTPGHRPEWVDAECQLPFAAITNEQRTEVGWHVARVTKRWALVFCQVEASVAWATALCSAPFGMEYVRTMVWIKPDGMPQYTGDRPGMGYESIVVCHKKGKKRWNGGGRHGVFTECKNAGRAPGTAAPHPTTKPLPLMRELVSLFSDPDELILDPFAGSGSTGVACRQLGRRFLGWELNRDYFDIACRRLRGEEAKPNPAQPSLFNSAT